MKCRLFKEAFRLFPIRQDARMGDRAGESAAEKCDFKHSALSRFRATKQDGLIHQNKIAEQDT